MKLTIVGCGDAFGSGGRLQTCFHVEAAAGRFLIDCGASALIGLNKLKLDPNIVQTIFISHLHGDHFGGLVWWLIHAHHVARRTEPLTVVGPEGVAQRFTTAAETLFPGSMAIGRRYELRFLDYRGEEPLTISGVRVTPFEVRHPSGAPSYALRTEADGKILSFSGDTEWVENLIPCANGADLFIAECYGFAREVPYHMTWRTIASNMDRLGARRVLLTHMNDEMLAHRSQVHDPRVIIAEDGLVLDV
jgi:ribonuclease BN (tRNA processing enzyme)